MAVLVASMMSGCQSPERFFVDDVVIDRTSWDSLTVSATFGQDRRLGDVAAVLPDLVVVTLFDEAYDTLFVGQPGPIPVPDHDLGDAERLLVEVCGHWQGFSACDQDTFQASPKRALADWLVTFPFQNAGYERSLVESDIEFERMQFEGEGWEQLRPSTRKEIVVVSSVRGHADSAIRLPVVRSEQRFILSRHAAYRDFRYAIQSQMLDTDSAAVDFKLYARLSPQLEEIASQTVVVRQTSTGERELEMQALVERSGAQVLEALEGFFGVRRAYVFVNDWSYESLDRAYRAEFELHWQEGFRGSWSDLTAEMMVRSDGTLGSVTFKRASERAQQRWDSRVGTPVLELTPLYPERMIDPTDVESQQENQERSRRR